MKDTKPICEQCESKKEKYSVTVPNYGATTLMNTIPAYWDEGGQYHESINPNHTTYIYTCSNGHSWKVVK